MSSSALLEAGVYRIVNVKNNKALTILSDNNKRVRCKDASLSLSITQEWTIKSGPGPFKSIFSNADPSYTASAFHRQGAHIDADKSASPWTFVPVEGKIGAYYIATPDNAFVMEFSLNPSCVDGEVILDKNHAGLNQQWKMEKAELPKPSVPVSDGVYRIISVAHDTFITDMISTFIHCKESSDYAATQEWLIKSASDGAKIITRADNGGYLGTTPKSGARIVLSLSSTSWRFEAVKDAEDQFLLWLSGDELALDHRTSKAGEAGEIHMYAKHGKINQRWRFDFIRAAPTTQPDPSKIAEGIYRILSVPHATYLTDMVSTFVYSKGRSKDAAPQEWYVRSNMDGTRTVTRADTGGFLGASEKSGARLTLNLAPTKWDFEPVQDAARQFVIAISDSNVAIDHRTSTVGEKGEVHMYPQHGKINQRWMLEFVRPPPEHQPDPSKLLNGIYRICSVSHGTYVTDMVETFVYAKERSEIQVAPQEWFVADAPGGAKFIARADTGMFLTTEPNFGARITPSKLPTPWMFQPVQDAVGQFILTLPGNRLAFDHRTSTAGEKGEIHLYTYHGHTNQRWIFEFVRAYDSQTADKDGIRS